MLLGLIINLYFSSKAKKNLSEKGKEHEILIRFFFDFVSSTYFTPIGQKYRILSWKVGYSMVISGFILGVILSSYL